MSDNLNEQEALRYEELKRKGNSRTKEEKAEFENLAKLISLPSEKPETKDDSVTVSRDDFNAFLSEMKALREQVNSMKADKRAGVETDEATDYDEGPKVYQGKVKIWQPRVTDSPKIFTHWLFIGETYNAKGQLELEYEFTLRDKEGNEEKLNMLYSTFAKISKYLTVDIISIDKKLDRKKQGQVYRQVQEAEDIVQTKEIVPLIVKEDVIMVTISAPEFGEVTLEEKYINN